MLNTNNFFYSLIKDENINDVLYNIIETSFDGIYITDNFANTIFVNKSYEHITGLDRKKLLGKNMASLVKDKIISASGTLLCLKYKKSITIEQEFKTGKKALITSSPTFDLNGNIKMVITNVRDLTKLYNLQDEILLKNELNNFFLKSSDNKNFVCNDEKFISLLKLADKIAKTDFTVTLLGETGVGKEILAKYIYEKSNRNNRIFLKINCGELNSNLIESELFGYEKGTFTGGNKDGKFGLFEMANGGTLFLDEIAELELGVQVKLLRVLQEQEIRRLGSSKAIKIDVRIITATNKDLKKLVEEGKFRKDLYYRLEALQLVIPPLRERKKDIIPLAKMFLDEFNKKYSTSKTFDDNQLKKLLTYDFPGNIRELKNIIERSYIISDSVLFFDTLLENMSVNINSNESLKEKIENLEYQCIKNALEKNKNIRSAANSLKMDPATFFRKKKKYNL